MDFFNLESSALVSPTRTVRYGRKLSAERQQCQPPSRVPQTVPLPKSEMFLRPDGRGSLLPLQQDLSGIRRYFRVPPTYTPLPIDSHQAQIIRSVKEHPVTIITAPTGAGKSCRVPQFILDNEFYKEQRHCKIAVTQPRRVAAVALARRVLSERGLPPIDYSSEGQGSLVGYQIGMDRQVNDDTRLIYMTTGVLLRKLCKSQTLNEFTHIILDEAHERDIETDFLLLLVKRFLCSNSKFVKIIVMSATVNSSRIAGYFSTLVDGIPYPSPVITIKDRQHNVYLQYLEGFKNSIGHHQEFRDVIRSSEPEITNDIYEVARSLIEGFDWLEANKLDDSDRKGSVLVFLPGIYEIETFYKILLKDAVSKTYTIIPLHSSIPRSDQFKVFYVPEPHKRKIVLSTNIAESSLTIPDIRYVIDFCLTKELVCDPSSGMSSLRCTWAPKSSLEQRAGRAGRVANGLCYRLASRRFTEHREEDVVPEMRRCSLERLVLWCRILGLGEPHHILSLALDPPDLDNLYQSVLILEEAGGLTRPQPPSEPFSGSITFLGQAMGLLPIDLRLTRIVMFGFVFSCFTECIIIAACLSLPGFLDIPFNDQRDKMKCYVLRMKKAAGTFSDPLMMLHVYNSWFEAHSKGHKAEQQFCKDNCIDLKRMQDVASLIVEISNMIQMLGIPQETMEERRQSYDDVTYITKIKLALAAANFPNYFLKDKDMVQEENCLRKFGNKSPGDTVMFTGMNLEVLSDEEAERKYIQDINNHFEQGFCNKVKSLSVESSRLYVTFENPAEQSVCKSVYYALKMKKLGFSLTLTDYGHRNESIACPYKRVMPIIRGESLVRVVYVVSPTKFYVQFITSKVREEWEETQARLQEIDKVRIPYQNLQSKRYGAAFFDDEVTLYRVRLEYYKGELMRVFFVDYGNYRDAPVNHIFEIPESLLTVPFQAVECSLENIAPPRHNLVEIHNGGWSNLTCAHFEDILIGQLFYAKLLYLMNRVLHLDLLADNHSLKQLLINQNHVTEPEPDFRVKLARNTTSNIAGIRLDTAFSVDDENFRPPYGRPNIRTQSCKLSGCTSPYETCYRGLSESVESRLVQVDYTSVNSVVINHNLAIQYQELLTATSVCVSDGSGRLQIRSSTSHAPVPGMPEIMVLLFSPQVQLHCSSSKLNYVGCRAGLGTDQSGAAVWKEHDLKVRFDVRMDDRDLVKINKVRMMISDLLLQDDLNPSTLHLTHQPIRRLQRKIWCMVHDLLNRKRELVIPTDLVQLTWNPPYGTRNTKVLAHRDSDILKPIPALLSRLENVVLETSEMRTRAQRLLELELEHRTGSREGRQSECYCEICEVRFEKAMGLVAHFHTDEHRVEKSRVVSWRIPT